MERSGLDIYRSISYKQRNNDTKIANHKARDNEPIKRTERAIHISTMRRGIIRTHQSHVSNLCQVYVCVHVCVRVWVWVCVCEEGGREYMKFRRDNQHYLLLYGPLLYSSYSSNKTPLRHYSEFQHNDALSIQLYNTSVVISVNLYWILTVFLCR